MLPKHPRCQREAIARKGREKLFRQIRIDRLYPQRIINKMNSSLKRRPSSKKMIQKLRIQLSPLMAKT